MNQDDEDDGSDSSSFEQLSHHPTYNNEPEQVVFANNDSMARRSNSF